MRGRESRVGFGNELGRFGRGWGEDEDEDKDEDEEVKEDKTEDEKRPLLLHVIAFASIGTRRCAIASQLSSAASQLRQMQ